MKLRFLGVAAMTFALVVFVASCGSKNQDKKNSDPKKIEDPSKKDKDKKDDKTGVVPPVTPVEPTKTSQPARPPVDNVQSREGRYVRVLLGTGKVGATLEKALLTEFTDRFGKNAQKKMDGFVASTCIQYVRHYFERGGVQHIVEFQNAPCPAKGIQQDETKIAFRTREVFTTGGDRYSFWNLTTDFEPTVSQHSMVRGRSMWDAALRTGTIMFLCNGSYAGACSFPMLIREDGAGWLDIMS